MAKILVIGYGNPSRNDDGVGLAAVNGLRRRLGLVELGVERDGFDELGRPLDTIFVHQLTLELAETVADYEQVYFVDAHTGVYEQAVHHEQVVGRYDPALVSHFLKPQSLMALVEQMYKKKPGAVLISVKGHDFGFGEILSEKTSAAVEEVVEELAGLVEG